MRTVYPIGTTIYDPQACCNGYTLGWGGPDVWLVDMNGREVRRWRVVPEEVDFASSREAEPGVDRAHLLPDGHVLVQRGGMMSTAGRIQEYDWSGQCVWEWVPQGRIPHEALLGPHHDVWRKADGHTLTICRYAVPEAERARIRDPRYRHATIYGDAIIEIDPDGQVVWDWRCHEGLDLDRHRILASADWEPGPHNSTACDWTHCNTVREIPPNRWHDAGDERFRPGNVIISPRSLDQVAIIDPRSRKVVWTYTGDYWGGLSGQHEPYMIPRGLPGQGNLLIFDNGASPWRDLAHCSRSVVLEINPVSGEVVWTYEKWLEFFSPYTSSAQRLANGNTLICESAGRRQFEVTPDGRTVWEHVRPTPRAYRYAYDFCGPTAELPRPDEVPVTPPDDFRLPADGDRR